LEAERLDRITLKNIVAHGRHGHSPGERDRLQALHIDLQLDLDLTLPARSDELADTVDYADVHRRVVHIVETRSFALLERLAGAILENIMIDAKIVRAELSIAKPGLLDGATPAVTIVRERES
jgi:7,8-dihydroneopterin aldolase/epimerase/oxygenase